MTERFRIVWADVAVQDLLGTVEYVIERDGLAAARDLHQRIRGAVGDLKTLPRRCRVVPELRAEGIDAYRELLVGPYRIMFALHGDEVVVVAVVDGRRDLEELLIERAMRG